MPTGLLICPLYLAFHTAATINFLKCPVLSVQKFLATVWLLKHSFSILTTESSRLSPCSPNPHTPRLISQMPFLQALTMPGISLTLHSKKCIIHITDNCICCDIMILSLIDQLKCGFFEKKNYFLFTCVYTAWYLADTQYIYVGMMFHKASLYHCTPTTYKSAHLA